MNNWLKKEQATASVIDLTKETKVEELISKEVEAFCTWLEAQYVFKKPLEIEMVDNYYLIHNGKRVGYLFFFDDEEVPLLVLPVKGYPEKWPLESILFSLLQGLDDYMALQNGKIDEEYYDEEALEEILQAYLKVRG